MKKISEVIIIGAGLSGLTTAYLLEKKKIPYLLLEASNRIGGRIETVKGSTGVTIEMGATWFGLKHKTLVALLKELNIDYFPQHTKGISLFETMSFVPAQQFEVPESEEPSYRIKGGSEILIHTLKDHVNHDSIRLNCKVNTIEEKEAQLYVHTDQEVFIASKVISTLPPNLLANSIAFKPELPEAIRSLCKKTHTWMGESIKFAVEYKNAFWKDEGYSGTLFSQSGIIQEQYDHSDADITKYALKGFLNNGTSVLTKAEREAKVKQQLVYLFGAAAGDYQAYHEKVWSEQPLTFTAYQGFVMPHQNNGHELYRQAFMHDKLFISGTETAAEYPGYMDGAVSVAQYLSEKIYNETTIK